MIQTVLANIGIVLFVFFLHTPAFNCLPSHTCCRELLVGEEQWPVKLPWFRPLERVNLIFEAVACRRRDSMILC